MPRPATCTWSVPAAGSSARSSSSRRLLAGAEDLIAAAGRPLARLDCVSRNPALRAYYRAAGYAEVGTREIYYGTITLFEKHLG
jgi:protein-tyrosine phosphatase